jgi:MFS family permease
VALTLPQLQREFDVDTRQIRYTTCATFIGLCIGASFWGIASDVIGRRLAFNCTLFLAGVFGIAVGGGPSWIAVCGMFAALGVGVGGNLPVDGALFLEFLPYASGGLLTMLSIWWPVGQLIASLSKSTSFVCVSMQNTDIYSRLGTHSQLLM